MQENQELPKGWVWTKIGQIASTSSGGTPSRSNPSYFTGTIPWIKSGELGDGEVSEHTEFISEEALANSSAKLFPKGTLLIALYGATVGKVGVLTMDAATNQAVCGIFLPPWVELKFAFNYLLSLRREFIEQGKGGAQPNISQDIVRNTPFPLAPLPEQRRIVAKLEELFSRLDAGVATLRQTQAQLKRYRQSVLHAAVTGELTRAWRAAHPEPTESGAALLQRIRAERRAQWEAAQLAKRGGQLPLGDAWKKKYEEPAAPDTSELPELPQGWVWASPEQIASSDKYSMAIGPFGSNLKVPDYREEGVPLVFVREIKSGKFGGPKTKYVTPAKAEELRAHQVASGDILITKMGEPPGDACLYPEGRPDAVITADCIKWTLDSNLENKEFYVYAINAHLVRVQIAFITQGVAQQKVSLGRFKTVAVPVPSLEEQTEIVREVERRLSVIDYLEKNITAELTRAERLRQSILHRAFTGRLVPQDAADEPAAALLERLQDAPATQPAAKGKRGRKARESGQTALNL
ncbi:restriction endonuclease [Hymenobacter lutimineralis]|uniref:Restriction endonuclease n=1 Tax=Hymenobacter lutimineralis TaxID=2606448 RepID=A0A5D6VEA3_9BACT|nr:restriction endonuclease subunit S [Hymenobacter lutimineralis]TYZ14401.1 restriction endonuclease [Hymenobacter lutimineralis]